MPDQSEHPFPLIAVTGATGFVGKRLVKTLLSSGFNVSALTRRSLDQSQENHHKDRYFDTSGRIIWVNGDLFDKSALVKLCSGASAVIHLAGLTNAVSPETYFQVNETGTLRLLEAAAISSVPRVLHVSSLAAREPHLAPYAASKRAGEKKLQEQIWPFDWLIIRPPAIYGPGDQELLKAIKLARGYYGPAVYPSPSGLDSRAAFLHVDDLATALTVLIDDPRKSIMGELDDGTPNGYTPHEIATAMAHDSGKSPKVIALPWIVKFFIGLGGNLVADFLEHPSKLMSDQLRYLSHPDWSINPSHKLTIEGWQPRFDLVKGMTATLDWYKSSGLLHK